MNFLLDQMLDVDIASTLRDLGYHVTRTCEIGLSRAPDTEVMERAIQDNRILITLDEHFGDWAVLPLYEHPGVIRIKAHPTTTNNILKVLLPFLLKNHDKNFSNHLIIISEKGYRWIDTKISSE